MITLRNLTTSAGTAITPNVDVVTIDEGEIVLLAGMSSLERRRLLAILALHSDEWVGEYELFGHRVHKLDNEHRAALRGELIGVQMRSVPLVDCLTVEENLEIPLTYRRIAAEERGSLIDEALMRLGVSAIGDKEIESLPLDQRQLVGIAKALVSNPRLVVLEEPSLNLNPLQLRLVHRELERLKGAGCIVVESVEQAESGVAVDRVIELDEMAPAHRPTRRTKGQRSKANGAVGYW